MNRKASSHNVMSSYHGLKIERVKSSNWQDILEYLGQPVLNHIRRSVCVSCGFAKLYDKYGKEYKISRLMPLEGVKHIINKIKSVNNE